MELMTARHSPPSPSSTVVPLKVIINMRKEFVDWMMSGRDTYQMRITPELVYTN